MNNFTQQILHENKLTGFKPYTPLSREAIVRLERENAELKEVLRKMMSIRMQNEGSTLSAFRVLWKRAEELVANKENQCHTNLCRFALIAATTVKCGKTKSQEK